MMQPATARPSVPLAPFRRHLPLLLALTAALQLAMGVRPAQAAEDEAAGRRHWDKGQELYKQGRFLEAAREFESGYQVAPRSNFLLNIGHSYRRAQELRKAKSAYESFLKLDPASPHRTMVEDLVRTIDDALSAQVDPAGATPRPTPTPLQLPPAGPPPANPSTTIDLSPPVAQIDAAQAPEVDSSPSIFRSPWFWGTVGAVVVAGVAGTVYGLSRGPSCSADRCVMEPPLP